MKTLFPPESSALPGQAFGFAVPQLDPSTLAAVCVLAVFALLLLTRKSGPHGRRHGWRILRPSSGANQTAFDTTDHATRQLAAIAAVAFERQPVLNREEARLLPLLEGVVADLGQGHRVLTQCALGELIRPRKTDQVSTGMAREACLAINSKRLDFACVDRRGLLCLAIEYQGTGHHQGSAFLRDAVKREAVRRAGATFLELTPDLDAARVRSAVLHALGAGTAVTASPSRRSHAGSLR